MTHNQTEDRHHWSSLSHLQLGRYAEHLAKMRFIEAGYEVYSSEVDDRGIDMLVRIAPGRCLEIQVKSVRKRNSTFIDKKHLGSSPAEVEQRLQTGYCMLFMLFEDGSEPQVYLIPGFAWLKPNAALVDNTTGDNSYGPYIEVRPSKKNDTLLEPYRFNHRSVADVVEKLRSLSLQ